MELSTKIYLLDGNGDKFMGIGVLWLLEAVDESSSLRQAAKKMELSYSKAYNMLSHLEESLGRPMVERRRGGHSREGIELTPFAREFIALYKDFQKEAKARAEDAFADFRRSLDTLMEEEDGKGKTL